MILEIDIDRLRKDLLDYFGTAMFTSSPLAIMNLTTIKNASDEEIIKIALDNNVDLNRYINNSKTR